MNATTVYKIIKFYTARTRQDKTLEIMRKNINGRLEVRGIDPRTSRMLSERSTI